MHKDIDEENVIEINSIDEARQYYANEINLIRQHKRRATFAVRRDCDKQIKSLVQMLRHLKKAGKA